MKKSIILMLSTFLALSVGCSKDADNTVLAKVNRTKITLGDLKSQLAELPPQMQQAVITDAQARKDFLDDLIGIEVVLQEAKRRGLDREPEFKRRVDEFIKNELFNNLLKKELAGKVAFPTDKEVREYYNKHKAEMRTATGKRLSFEEAEPQLRTWLFQQKQRQSYIEFAKGLKEKAKIKIDEKAIASAGEALSAPLTEQKLQLRQPPVPEGNKKQQP